LRNYFQTQVGDSLPHEMMEELDALKKRIEAMPH